MAAPALSSRAGSPGNGSGNSPTVAAARLLAHGGVGPELDFRSAARMEDVNRLIQEFSKHDQREYDDQRALEIHTAKDFIFSMLGEARRGEARRGEGTGGDGRGATGVQDRDVRARVRGSHLQTHLHGDRSGAFRVCLLYVNIT